MSREHVSSVSTVFRRMLQLLYLDVSKVDQVLHLSSPSAASSRCVLIPTSVGHPYDAAAGPSELEALHPSHSCRSGPAGPAWSARASGHGNPSGRAGASTTVELVMDNN